MSGFDLDWLDLRRDADNRARSGKLVQAAASHVSCNGHPLIVDLGSGAGASVHALAPLLQKATHWRLVDNDAALLTVASERCGARIECVLLDLSKPAALPLRGAHLVTASALLDLVSGKWIEDLVLEVRQERADFYAPLTANGAIEWLSPHPADEAVSGAFNRHHAGDKGFGPALGGSATAYARHCFQSAGYDVQVEPSPWHLGAQDRHLIRALATGMAQAVSETGEIDASKLKDWTAFRLASAESGCTIGHYDLLASPTS